MFLQKELPAMVFITDAQEKACDLLFLNTSVTTLFTNDQEQRLTAARVASTLNLPGIVKLDNAAAN